MAYRAQDRGKIDVIAALIILLLGIVIIFLFSGQRDIGVTVLLAGSIYLLFRRGTAEAEPISLKISDRQRGVLRRSLYITSLFIFTATLLLYHWQLYERPIAYFVLISLLAGIIAVEILLFREKDRAWPVLLQIFLLLANIRIGIFYEFPSIWGADAYAHAKIVEVISQTGSIPSYEAALQYAVYPVFNLAVAMTQIITSLGIKEALFCSAGFTAMVVTLLVYYIGRAVAGPKIGLLALLLAAVSTSLVSIAVNITPGLLGCFFFILIFYLAFRRGNEAINKLLMIFLTLAAILTHQLSIFVALIALAALAIGKKIHEAMHGLRQNIGVSMTYVLLFFIAMQSYWMYRYISSSQTFFDRVLGPLIRVLKSGMEFGAEEAVTYQVLYSTSANILFHLGYLMLLFFAIGGTLLCLSSRDNKRFSIAFAPIILYMFIYGISAFGIRNFLPGRWFPILSVFLVILASVYLTKLTHLIKPDLGKIAVSFGIVAVVAFFMITTPNINKDNPFYAMERAGRNQFMASEIASIETINDIYSGTIYVDYSLVGGIFRQMNINSAVEPFDVDYVTVSLREEESGSMIILRECALGRPVGVIDPESPARVRQMFLSQEFFDSFYSPGYDLVYTTNAGVLGYLAK